MKNNRKIIIKSYKKPAYSLVEMLVTLLLTSIIMLALITLLTTILKVSAITHNRSKIREDLKNFVLEFEKDLRNSSRVGRCEGNKGQFYCEVYTNALYIWQSCPRDLPDMCDGNGCTNITYQTDTTMCKYISVGGSNTLVSKFDEMYNLEEYGVQVIETNSQSQPDQQQNNSTPRRLISFTAVASHPNKRLGIENIIRQTFVSTKNFENIIKKD